jgi:hypothetical protein
MKIKPGATAPTVGEVIGTTQLSLPTNVDGIITAKRQPNNLRSTSSTYITMNNLVVALDASFHALPASGTPDGSDQAAWNANAEGYTGIAVCGCPKDTINGQKLYRLANWQNATAGQPYNSVAPTGPPPVLYGPITIICVGPDDPRFPAVVIDCPENFVACTVIFQMGKGAANTSIVLPAGEDNIQLGPGDPGYGALSGGPEAVTLYYCMFDPQGLPGGMFHCSWINENAG